ncbi:MAG: helix-turn-helix domain-containing protein [Paludibacteraceae bacterium]|nr:helix-turn-helix domain-containing protein [Paludibacteraceae bacterium]
MVQTNNIHIGSLIKEELTKQGRKQTWLAEQICCDNTNICKLLNRKSIDCDQLLKISIVLGVDFFAFYTSVINCKN